MDSAWACENNLVLEQVITTEKPYEIITRSELLNILAKF